MTKKKFRLSTIQHRTQKVNLTHDVVIDGEIVPDYVVGWVEIMGADNPRYLNKCKTHIIDYKAAMDDINEAESDSDKTKLLEKTLLRFETQAVSNSLVGWDVEFFEKEFSEDEALDFFTDPDNNTFYNQIAGYMQKRSDFLPIAGE